MSTHRDLSSAYCDDEKHSQLRLGELLWLWGALAWLVIAAIVGSGVMIAWLWRLIARLLP